MEENNNDSPLVLRTVYIPKNSDDKLRELAYKLGRSKNDLIREGIELILQKLNIN